MNFTNGEINRIPKAYIAAGMFLLRFVLIAPKFKPELAIFTN